MHLNVGKGVRYWIVLAAAGPILSEGRNQSSMGVVR